MRTTGQIIEACMEGEKPSIDEMRLTICAMQSLIGFQNKALMELYKAEKEKLKPFLTRSAIYQAEENLRRQKTCYSATPEHWLGESHHPDSEECKRWRALSKKILKHACAAVTADALQS